jgi:hypothetical protein
MRSARSCEPRGPGCHNLKANSHLDELEHLCYSWTMATPRAWTPSLAHYQAGLPVCIRSSSNRETIARAGARQLPGRPSHCSPLNFRRTPLKILAFFQGAMWARGNPRPDCAILSAIRNCRSTERFSASSEKGHAVGVLTASMSFFRIFSLPRIPEEGPAEGPAKERGGPALFPVPRAIEPHLNRARD